jgi:hypothetical protein
VRFVFAGKNRLFPGMELWLPSRFISGSEVEVMLVERGLQVMNVEVVGDAYAIASNYLRRTGTISDTFATNEQLLQIIVEMFRGGELNRLKLANKAIAKFEAAEVV